MLERRKDSRTPGAGVDKVCGIQFAEGLVGPVRAILQEEAPASMLVV